VHFQIHSICQLADRVGQVLQSSQEPENSSQTHGHLHLNIRDVSNNGRNLVLLRKGMLGLGWARHLYPLQIERIRHRLLERLVRGRGSRLVQSRGDRHCRLHLQVLWRGFGRCQIPRLRGSWTWLRSDRDTKANYSLIYLWD
jgi:hypothetical protein